jgi:hypothetical protein
LPNLTKEEAIKRVNALTKEELISAVKQVPDYLIVSKVKKYFQRRKEAAPHQSMLDWARDVLGRTFKKATGD